MKERPKFIDQTTQFSYVGSGRRFDVYDLGDFVAKELKKPENEKDPTELAYDFLGDYKLLKQYLGDYVVPTDFIIGEQESRPSVFMIQPDTHGLPISDLVREQLRTPYIIDFFKRSLQLYNETGHMPDIYGRPHVIRWYTHPQTSPNVIVSEKDSLPFPNLIDVLFTRNSVKPLIGGPHNRLLAEGTKRLLRSLGG